MITQILFGETPESAWWRGAGNLRLHGQRVSKHTLDSVPIIALTLGSEVGGAMATFFSDYFRVDEEALNNYGAFNISLVNDLPLFVDPFLLYHSEKPAYISLHDQIISYLVFLKNKSSEQPASKEMLKSWYCFPEIKQTWLGFSTKGNIGSGLGMDFARILHKNLHLIFSDFGEERVTDGSHLEKICLISNGVGRDNISDFTTNIILDYLCKYTQSFVENYLSAECTRIVSVRRAKFNYNTETWQPYRYRLPWVNNDFVILTPKEILTRDENWINRDDLISNFEWLPPAISDDQLRFQVSIHFERELSRFKDQEITAKAHKRAASLTLQAYPQIIDYYIRSKENSGDQAASISAEKVSTTEELFVHQAKSFQNVLNSQSKFYETTGSTYDEAHKRLAYLKDIVENKGGHRVFYVNGEPITRETHLQILYRLVWIGTPSDVSAEVNDGRGPVDFKISRGRTDKTLVEMKLARNSKLERNLRNQVKIYQAASDAEFAIKAIVFFTESEHKKLLGILDKLDLRGDKDVVLIDARADNKPSGSNAL